MTNVLWSLSVPSAGARGRVDSWDLSHIGEVIAAYYSSSQKCCHRALCLTKVRVLYRDFVSPGRAVGWRDRPLSCRDSLLVLVPPGFPFPVLQLTEYGLRGQVWWFGGLSPEPSPLLLLVLGAFKPFLVLLTRLVSSLADNLS